MKRAWQDHGSGARLSAALALALAFGLPTCPAAAVIIDSGDGTGNIEAPNPDPGWAHVGRRLGGPSLVYLGNGWVITARHVGAGVVLIGGERYDPVAESILKLDHPDGMASDLMLFRIKGNPALPELPLLPIARRPPRLGSELIMVGFGRDRGDRLTHRPASGGLYDGWFWNKSGSKRWGTNQMGNRPIDIDQDDSRTRAIVTSFNSIDDPSGTRHEA